MHARPPVLPTLLLLVAVGSCDLLLRLGLNFQAQIAYYIQQTRAQYIDLLLVYRGVFWST
jgi:hypothetical protein